MNKEKFAVLFVCLGNICRSPLAEAVFRDLVKQRNLQDKITVDSCGTGNWHVGKPPHEETRRVAKKYNISMSGIQARQVASGDFESFDLLVAMDLSNLSDLKRLRGGAQANIICLREFDYDDRDLNVPDPYYGGPEGFEEVYQIVSRCCAELLDEIAKDL